MPERAKAYCERTIVAGVRIKIPNALMGQGSGESHATSNKLTGFEPKTLETVSLKDRVLELGPVGEVTYINSPMTEVGLNIYATTTDRLVFAFLRTLICTAGPMLIDGPETYMLTAGHCFGRRTSRSGEAIGEQADSALLDGVEKEVGAVGLRYRNEEHDIAEVKVRPGNFTEALPDPVPALMAEWGLENPEKPRAVEGVAEAVDHQIVCHEGQASGEHCGEITKLDATLNEPTGKVLHLVEVTACSNAGDSGGPYFIGSIHEAILMMGTEVGGPELPDCSDNPPYKDYFEPLLDLPGVPGVGTLSTFNRQRLLTTANEVRPGSPVTLSSSGEPTLVTFKGKAEKRMSLGILGVANLVECGATEVEGSTEGNGKLGRFHVTASKCKTNVGGTCTGLGDVSGSILTGGTWHLVFAKLGTGVELDAGMVFLVEHAHFTCTVLFASKLVLLLGEVICLITPTNTLSRTAKITCQHGAEDGDPALVTYWNEEGKKVELTNPLKAAEDERTEAMASEEGESEVEFTEAVQLDA